MIETFVTDPAGEADAPNLAREQFAYAPDIVWQGVNDVQTLATIYGSNSWYFWWD